MTCSGCSAIESKACEGEKREGKAWKGDQIMEGLNTEWGVWALFCQPWRDVGLRTGNEHTGGLWVQSEGETEAGRALGRPLEDSRRTGHSALNQLWGGGPPEREEGPGSGPQAVSQGAMRLIWRVDFFTRGDPSASGLSCVVIY